MSEQELSEYVFTRECYVRLAAFGLMGPETSDDIGTRIDREFGLAGVAVIESHKQSGLCRRKLACVRLWRRRVMKAKAIVLSVLVALPLIAWALALTQYQRTYPEAWAPHPSAGAAALQAAAPAAIDLPETRLVGQIRHGFTQVWHVRQRTVGQHCFEHVPLQGGPKSVKVCVPVE